jgi:hypothetical protein
MRNTKSARAFLSLGATLIAVIFSGQSLAGISGVEVAGISGGDRYGISGGDRQGISGGDRYGISGGDRQGISGGDRYGISGGDRYGISGGDFRVLAGPIDSIDHTNGAFESMGQVVLASQRMLSSMQVGDYVSVQGSIISSGWYFADSVSVSDQRYVAGSTKVFIAGKLSSINTSKGTAQMGGLTIDYTSSLGSSRAPSGSMWSFAGIRSSSSGTMISDRTAGIR